MIDRAKLQGRDITLLSCNVTELEIKIAPFGIDDNKARRVDDLNVFFFKKPGRFKVGFL